MTLSEWYNRRHYAVAVTSEATGSPNKTPASSPFTNPEYKTLLLVSAHHKQWCRLRQTVNGALLTLMVLSPLANSYKASLSGVNATCKACELQYATLFLDRVYNQRYNQWYQFPIFVGCAKPSGVPYVISAGALQLRTGTCFGEIVNTPFT